MFLSEPSRTPYDLSFRIGWIPVRVSPWFWVASAVLGWQSMQDGVSYLLMWIACVFLSILVHELGHVVVGQLFGSYGHIVLHTYGGLAIGSSNLRNRWQRIAVYFAGPCAGFLLLAIVLGPFFALDREWPPLVFEAIRDLFWINLFWGLLNLLPIWPLDGGQISRDLFDWVRPRNGVRLSLGLSIIVASVLAVNSFMATNGPPLIPFIPIGGLYITLFFALFAVQSYQLMQQLPPDGGRREEERDDPWSTNSGFRDSDPDHWRR